MKRQKAISIIIGAAINGCLVTALAFSQPNKKENELRERCGKRTEEIWKKEFEDNIANSKDVQVIGHYENHYNAKLNKCFYLTKSSVIGKEKVMKIERLFDVDANKEYGMFTSDSDDSLAVCVLYVERGKGRCSSENEWRQLIKPYMEEGS
jgi:hypothetical protein